MKGKKFDLNIETILEDWEIHHAIREIIANALDEQKLTNTKDIEIFKDHKSRWHIRDYGRGLKYHHLTQNENDEKLRHPNLIGKFGVGLKDALATFYRNNVDVLIISKHGVISLEKAEKTGFEDLMTLHAIIKPPYDHQFIGTEFILAGVPDREMALAKKFFLKFSKEKTLDTTSFGEILEKENNIANIYINGVKVAEEENFMFSYNITSIDTKIKRALNRERSNVGRSAYSDRIKNILLASRNEKVMECLAKDIIKQSTGESHDELHWIDVQEHAVKILSTKDDVVLLTNDEIMEHPNMVDDIRRYNQIVTINKKLKERIRGQLDLYGNPIRDFYKYIEEYEQSFEYKFIHPSELSKEEREIYNLTDDIVQLFGGLPNKAIKIKISENIRPTIHGDDTVGVWDVKRQEIIIKRTQLSSVENYAGTLIHELIHAKFGVEDVTRDFEVKLTQYIGKLCAMIVKNKYYKSN